MAILNYSATRSSLFVVDPRSTSWDGIQSSSDDVMSYNMEQYMQWKENKR